MKNKKGFTLIELLVVGVLIGILLLIAAPAINKYLKRGTKEYYNSLENNVLLAGRDYLNDYRALLPREVNNVTVIELEELTQNKYIGEVVDSNGNLCRAKVTAKKVGTKEYEYYSCLICGDDYQTVGEACEYDENNNITAETKNYRVEIDIKDGDYEIDANGIYIVHQGDKFELPTGKVYYTQNGIETLLKEVAQPNPKNVDTNKLGTTKVKFVYKGAFKEITVKVIDVVKPSIPQIVLRQDNAKGNVYQGNWYSGDIYQEFKSTDYSLTGIVGSGIKAYEISNDGKTFEEIEGNHRTSTENGEYTFYVRSVDKSGNISNANTYHLKIDKEIPQCTLKSSGTAGNTGWYISDAKTEFDSKTEKVSSIKSEKIDSPNVTSDVKNKKITGSVIDQAGNEGKCYETVSVDKTNPTVSYNVASGIYNSNKTVTVTGSDTYFSYMNIETKKNGSIVNSDSNITSKTKNYTLTHGSWTISTTAYDESGRNGAKNINYTIDTKLPTCSLKVTSGTAGNNGWYTSDVTVGFASTDGTGTNISTSSIDKSSVTSEGKTTVTGTVTDQAGNVGNCSLSPILIDKTNPTVSYNVAGGIYNSNKTVTVTASDTYFSYMNIHVYKNGTISNADNNLTSKTKSYTLTDGSWTVYTQAYDQSGRKQNQTPDNGSGWYYQNYTIDTKAPTCSLKVTSGTAGNNGWYKSNVTVGFASTDGTGTSIVTSTIDKSSVTSEGTTTVTGTVTDQAGNVGTCSITVNLEVSVSTPGITYNGGSNSCSWKNNYNLTLSSSAKSGIAHYEIDWDNNGTVDTTTGSNFIPWNGYHSCTTRFRAVSNAGNRSSWTANQHIHMDTELPGVPTITYNGGSNSCSWKNNYNLTLASSDNIGIAYYEIDYHGNGTVDETTGSNFIPPNGWSTCTAIFRAVDHAGNRSGWTSNQHIHMDTQNPQHTNWWWGEVTKDVARLYIQTTDNIGINRVECPTSTASGGYNNWYMFNAVWDSGANAYRCDITPATFGHYGQTYITHLYIYDHAGNGGYYNQTSINIPAKQVTLAGSSIMASGRYDQYGLCYYISQYGMSNSKFDYGDYKNCYFTSYNCNMSSCDNMGWGGWYGWGNFSWNDGGEYWDIWDPVTDNCEGTIVCDG